MNNKTAISLARFTRVTRNRRAARAAAALARNANPNPVALRPPNVFWDSENPFYLHLIRPNRALDIAPGTIPSFSRANPP